MTAKSELSATMSADAQAEEPVDLPHPCGVSRDEVVVHRDEVDAAAGKGVQVDRQRRDEGLAFARLHLGDPAEVERHPAHQLDVEMALADRAPGSLPADGERLDEEVVHVLAVVEPLLELDRLRGKGVVVECADLRLEPVDQRHHRGEILDLPALTGAEDLREDTHDAPFYAEVPRQHRPGGAGETDQPRPVGARHYGGRRGRPALDAGELREPARCDDQRRHRRDRVRHRDQPVDGGGRRPRADGGRLLRSVERVPLHRRRGDRRHPRRHHPPRHRPHRLPPLAALRLPGAPVSRHRHPRRRAGHPQLLGPPDAERPPLGRRTSATRSSLSASGSASSSSFSSGSSSSASANTATRSSDCRSVGSSR